jgi:flagellar hook-length control protein FliK
MIRTSVHKSSENNSYFQGVNPHLEELKGAGSEASDDSSSGDEFSSIMDKIAARFSHNLGFDYTSLLNQGQIKATQVAETNEAKKTENMAHAEIQSSKNDDVNNERAPDGNFKAEIKTPEKKEKEEKSAAPKEETKPVEVKEAKPETIKDSTSEAPKKTEDQVAATPEKINNEQIKVQEATQVPAKELQTEVVKMPEQAPVDGEIAEAADKAPIQVKAGKEVSENKTTPVEKKAAKDVKLDLGETEAPVEVIDLAIQTPKIPGNQQDSAASEAKSKEVDTKAAMAAGSNLLTDLFLNASFLSKDISAAQSQQNAANSQSIKSITEAVKDKIVTSMNNAVSNANFNASGSFSNKVSSERSESLKERAFTQQPQMLKAFEKVETALKEAAKARDGKTISLRLDPPNLGTVKVDVTLKEGTLHARIHADNQNVNQFLRECSHDLQHILRKLGLSVEKIIVSVNNENPEHDVAQNSGGDFKQAMSDKENKGQGESNFGSENGFGFSSELPAQAETTHLDHWVA